MLPTGYTLIHRWGTASSWLTFVAVVQGGGSVLYCDVPHLQVKAYQSHGLNAVSSLVSSNSRRWFLIGCYITPDNKAMIKGVASAILQRPHGAELLVAVYFYSGLDSPYGVRQEE